MAKVSKQEALDYHKYPRPGKIEVIPTKPYATQADLGLAYSPGVAYPCLEIKDDPDKAYPKYSKTVPKYSKIAEKLPQASQNLRNKHKVLTFFGKV